MFTEDDLLPLSALQHLLFCERQCALIHVEQLWVENSLTAEGRHLHERADAGQSESRGNVHIARGVPLHSLRLGLSGKADLVEFHHLPGGQVGAILDGRPGHWRVVPIEYKRGRPKAHRADEVQLCAQAMCLEEMLGADVPIGALFYGETRRRKEIALDAGLRALTEATAARLHRLVASRITPAAIREPKCDRCSLLEVCMPGAAARSAGRYLARVLREACEGEAWGGSP